MAYLKRPGSVILVLMGVLFVISVFVRTGESRLFTTVQIILVCAIVVAFIWGIVAAILSLLKDRKFNRIRLFRHLIGLCIAAPFIYLILVSVSDLISRRMEIYAEVEEKLQASSAARGLLGEPVSIGWPIALTTEVSTKAGHAEMTIPVHGNHGRAELYVSGLKDNGVWTITDLYLIEKEPVGTYSWITSVLPAKNGMLNRGWMHSRLAIMRVPVSIKPKSSTHTHSSSSSSD